MLDELVAGILELIFAPYRWWKDRGDSDSSIVGQSEYDKKAARFWKWAAWIAVFVILVLVGVCWMVF